MKRPVVVLILALWFVAAVAAVTAGALARLPVPPPAIVAVLAAIVIASGLFTRSGRETVAGASVRLLLLPHLVRFVGIAFLLLVRRGVLVSAFTPIGWGDAIAATGALVLLAARPDLSRRGAGWWTVLAWNAFGLGDMLLLIVTGIRLGLADPSQFALFRTLPFGLLPTFFVPLIVASHVFIFVRLFASRSARP